MAMGRGRQAGLRLGLGFLLALVLGLAGNAVWPGSSQAAPAHDDTVVYVVRPGDTLRSIAAANNSSIAAIVRANGLANPDFIYPGQKLVIPVQVAAPSTPGATNTPGATAAGPGVTPTGTPAAVAPTGTPAAAPIGTPTGPAESPGGAGEAGAGVFHTVQLGDTLASIGRAYGVGAAAIAEANGVGDPDLIWVGQKLMIPGAHLAGPAGGTPSGQPTGQPGEGAAAATSQATQPPASPPQATQPPAAMARPSVYVVQAGDTLGKIAQRFGTSVAALVAVNDLPSSDILAIGQQLIIPRPGDPALTNATLRPSKFVVSISQQRCWLYQGDTVIAKWVCSTGRPGAGTRPGSYKIQSKMPKAFGSTWNIWMPYWLGIYYAGASENGIHGLPWNASTGAQVWTGYVGTPITYGCVMLDNVNAKMLYNVAYIGMPVIIKP